METEGRIPPLTDRYAVAQGIRCNRSSTEDRAGSHHLKGRTDKTLRTLHRLSSTATARRFLWLGGALVCMAAMVLGVSAGPRFGLEYWYLVAAPPVAVSFLFGFRGGLVLWAPSLLALVASLYGADLTFWQEPRVVAGTALQSGVLTSVLPELLPSPLRNSLVQALAGTSLFVVCSLLVGLSVDRRNHATLVLRRTAEQFQRYVAPRVALEIVRREGAADLSTFSTRREVTLLFSDLRGFTALSERMEPEDVVALLNEFFDAMTDEVIRHKGTLDKYIGDELMAFFGDGDGDPADHVESAIRCGLAMQQRMRQLNAHWLAAGRETIHMGVGISTGVGVIGNVGSSRLTQYTAIGSMVNVASRLADIAKPGQILTTRKTFTRLRSSIGSIALDAISVKGIPTPVDVVEVIGSRAGDAPGTLALSRRWLEIIERVIEDGTYRAVLLRSPQEAAERFPLTQDEEAFARQVGTLCGYPLFRNAPPDEIAALLSMCSVEVHETGDLLVTEGASDDRLFLTLDGEVFVTQSARGAPEQHVASLRKGDAFGEQALMFDEPRSASVRAASACTFLVLHREQFPLLLEKAPVIRDRIEYIARSRRPDYVVRAA